MIGALIAWGVGPRIAKLLVYVAMPLLIVGFLWWRLDAYGDRRFNEGVEKTDAKWELAVERLREQARQSATKADDAAAVRLERQVEQTTRELERIEDAEANGSSPLDAIFN